MQERKLVAKALYTNDKKVEKWAVIVGISEYEYKPWNLNYAHRDAEELYQLLLAKNGGNFKQQNICKLINQNATKRNIEIALHSFLQKPGKNDLVIIYFACHGAPDPNTYNKNLYLLTHDTEPDKVAATGLRMRELDDALRDTLIANKVIIFADTCHSAGIGGQIGSNNRSASNNSELVNKYLKDLRTAKGGVALLTSARATELSREGKQWGGGHGVFTHFVLEGMRGKADRDRNGIVTVNELFEFVSDQVKQATDNKQHPYIGSNGFDPNLPIAIVDVENSKLFFEPRKLEPIEEDGSKVVPEPLKIVSKVKLRDILDNFGQSNIYKEAQIKSRSEYRQRENLLEKVKKFWIERFLEPSLSFNPALNLDKAQEPFKDREVIPFDIDDQTKQTDIIDRLRNETKTLLILGEPGSGKTIALLQLAKRLIKQTEDEKNRPIPVIFNLSSWGQKDESLEKWLIKELKDKYYVPETISQRWLKEEQLQLLLDGLDEVGVGLEEQIAKKKRNACVIAIKEFIADDHLETEIVVCSRVKDYEALVERLDLSNSICIQPFSKQQLLDFLGKADDSLLGLKTVIEQNREIAEFAQNPLILNMMTWTYQGWLAKKCYRQFRIREDREFNLFESYIKNNLKRDNIKKDKYSKKAIDWLSWLAKTMVSESKTIFLIEELQPTLLESIGQKISYRISNIILGGLIVFLIVGLSWGLLDLQTGLVFGLSASFSGGIIGFGLLKEITLFEQISCKWLLSWQKTKSSMILTLILVLIFIVTFGLIQKQITYELLGLFIGVIIYAPFTFLINSVVNSKLKIEERTEPKQGILLSINNSIRLGLIGGLIGGIFWGLFVGLFVGLDKNLLEGIKYGFSAGLTSAIFTGGIVELRYGGAACIQHFNLCQILYRKGRIPKDYADFLNYATDIHLMKKVGGGYIFYHRMLMEHFARRKSN